MLLREQRGRHQDRDLFAILYRDERRTHRNFGLAEADVAADQTIHRFRAREVGDDFVDRAPLIRGDVERELIDEALVVGVRRGHRGAAARLAMRVDVQQLRGDVVNFLGRAAFCFVPLVGAEPMQRRVRFVGAAVARDQVQCADGNVELRLVRVLDRREFGSRAVDLERSQAQVAADAVIDVDDRRADVQFGEVANDLVRIDRARVAPCVRVGARAKYLGFGDQRECLGHHAAFDRRDVERERGRRLAKCGEVVDVDRPQPGAREELVEHLAAPGGFGAEQDRHF